MLQLLKESPDRVQKIFLGKNVSESFSRQIKTLAEKGGVVVQVLAPEVLSEICGPVNHQGVACKSSEVSMADLGIFSPRSLRADLSLRSSSITSRTPTTLEP